MPVVDMPLEQLKEYQGINPRPADFDSYWEDALRELDDQSLDYTLEKADFQVDGLECYHLYFTGVGGARIHCKFIKPSHIEGKIPAVCMFHGYTGSCGDWSPKLPFAYNGMVVAALDVRGQAGLSEDTLQTKGSTCKGHIVRGATDEDPRNLAYRAIFLDTAHLARILMHMPFVDETRVGACGYSQGGALTLACAALEPRIKIASAGAPFLCDYKRVWEMDLVRNNAAYEEIMRYFYLQDPQHKTEEAFFTRLGYIDIQHLAPRIKAKVTFVTGLMDTVCPPSTQFAAYNKITAPKEVIVYPDFAHEWYPLYDDELLQRMKNL